VQYLHAHDGLLERRERVGRDIKHVAVSCVWAAMIAYLCCLR
jgi:hypothetical protein